MLSTSANLNLRAWFCIIGNYLRRLPFFAYWRRELQLLTHARKHLISKKKQIFLKFDAKLFSLYGRPKFQNNLYIFYE